MTTITAFPLCWPLGWKRTKSPDRSRYGDRSLAVARKEVETDVRLLGGTGLIISSNLELRLDGLPRSGQRQPFDKGVAVHFVKGEKRVAFACDKWLSVEDNLWGVHIGLESIRRLERCGMSEMLERAFTGFAALPAPSDSWFEVLEVGQDASLDVIRAAYREKVKAVHPDKPGGGADSFDRLTKAYKAALASLPDATVFSYESWGG